MKYMIMTFGDQSAWDALGIGGEQSTWSEEEVKDHFQAMGAFIDELYANDEMVTGFGLTDPSHARTVEVRDGRPVTSDGPYAEAKEVLAGFLVIEVDSHDRALEHAARFAGLVRNRVELRPVDESAGQDL